MMGFYGNVLVELDKADEAEPLGLELHERAVTMYGEGHLQVARAATLLVDIYEALGDDERYDFWYERIRGTPFDPGAPSQ
jgi:hypothetical protein